MVVSNHTMSNSNVNSSDDSNNEKISSLKFLKRKQKRDIKKAEEATKVMNLNQMDIQELIEENRILKLEKEEMEKERLSWLSELQTENWAMMNILQQARSTKGKLNIEIEKKKKEQQILASLHLEHIEQTFHSQLNNMPIGIKLKDMSVEGLGMDQKENEMSKDLHVNLCDIAMSIRASQRDIVQKVLNEIQNAETAHLFGHDWSNNLEQLKSIAMDMKDLSVRENWCKRSVNTMTETVIVATEEEQAKEIEENAKFMEEKRMQLKNEFSNEIIKRDEYIKNLKLEIKKSNSLASVMKNNCQQMKQKNDALKLQTEELMLMSSKHTEQEDSASLLKAIEPLASIFWEKLSEPWQIIGDKCLKLYIGGFLKRNSKARSIKFEVLKEICRETADEVRDEFARTLLNFHDNIPRSILRENHNNIEATISYICKKILDSQILEVEIDSITTMMLTYVQSNEETQKKQTYDHLNPKSSLPPNTFNSIQKPPSSTLVQAGGIKNLVHPVNGGNEIIHNNNNNHQIPTLSQDNTFVNNKFSMENFDKSMI